MKLFEDWCALKRAAPVPASPALIAEFVQEISRLGIDEVWEAVCAISKVHNEIALADPTRSDVVTRAVNAVSRIEPPRSWPKREKERFLSLPHDLQVFYCMREQQREAEVRRAQNEAARVIQELKELTDGKAAAA